MPKGFFRPVVAVFVVFFFLPNCGTLKKKSEARASIVWHASVETSSVNSRTRTQYGSSIMCGSFFFFFFFCFCLYIVPCPSSSSAVFDFTLVFLGVDLARSE